ncbi:ribosomal protein S2 [Corchorus olitorius]|uniref:Ribosomal protein S2 n=1 Tax=Corchorus olitorius TaxID=93759 RepID=A0A1R3L0T7_9ROSI|nr:ribosomal protein S2 [Corchorus olitorius]
MARRYWNINLEEMLEAGVQSWSWYEEMES